MLIRRHGGMSPERLLFRAYNFLPTYRQQFRRQDFTNIRELTQEIDAYERLQVELKRAMPLRVAALSAHPPTDSLPVAELRVTAIPTAAPARLSRPGNRCVVEEACSSGQNA